jgi:hypothetical protein
MVQGVSSRGLHPKFRKEEREYSFHAYLNGTSVAEGFCPSPHYWVNINGVLCPAPRINP